MPLVTVSGVDKSYGARSVLRSVSLTVVSGDRVGVVGRNGAGKSTLAKILAGVETPDAGTVTRRRAIRVLYLPQVPVFEGDPTAEEAVSAGLGAWSDAVDRHRAASDALTAGASAPEPLLAMQALAAEDVERLGGWEQRHRVVALLGHLGIERVQARVSTLSGGEQRRVALAQVLVARPDLAVLDEPTNHLDAETVEWFEQHLIDDFAGAVVLITHDRYLLDRVVAHTVEVADGAVHLCDGGYQRYLEQKAERLAHAARVEQNRQNFLRRELEWLRRQPKARTTKQAARVERAEAARLTRAPTRERNVRLDLDVTRAGKTVLELHGLEVAIGGKTLVLALDLCLTAGDRIGVVGRNGSGKTTLLRTILGEHPPTSGRVVLGQNTRLAYFDQERSCLDDAKTVFENALGDQAHVELGGRLVEPRAYLERFGFDGHQQRQPVGSLSGGERARVALAGLLRQSANLIMLDEPTNDLDLETLGALEAMLIEQGASALVVTHDRWFLDRVATAILAFEADGNVALYPGNYSSFRALRAQAAAERRTAPPASPATTETSRSPRAAPVKKRPLTFAEERELAALPDLIGRAEARSSELEQRLSDRDTYTSGGVDVGRFTTELASAQVALEQLMARWEELETKKIGS
jgi:ABC transport system ATP-binding/permease protein